MTRFVAFGGLDDMRKSVGRSHNVSGDWGRDDPQTSAGCETTTLRLRCFALATGP
jgi:hypothetical protein